MSAASTVLDFLGEAASFLFRPESRLWPVHLVAMVGIAFAIYLRANSSTSFVRWAFPKRVYAHKSHLTDVKLFLVGQGLTWVGFFNIAAVTTLMATAVVNVVGGGAISEETRVGTITITLLLVLASDFSVYWVHRLHHQTSVLWPFHSVHHSAEVMTPITVYRKHPIYDIISTFTKGLLAGLTQGLLLALFVGQVQVTTIATVNAGYFLFNIIGSNLRHTHIWLSYGRVLEHIFVSPAQHQIHHSVERRHFNKNYGEVFAFWDWMFGTLYVPESRERLQFGLSDSEGNPVEQPHNGLGEALWVPLKDSWNSLRPRTKTSANSPSLSAGEAEPAQPEVATQ